MHDRRHAIELFHGALEELETGQARGVLALVADGKRFKGMIKRSRAGSSGRRTLLMAADTAGRGWAREQGRKSAGEGGPAVPVTVFDGLCYQRKCASIVKRW